MHIHTCTHMHTYAKTGVCDESWRERTSYNVFCFRGTQIAMLGVRYFWCGCGVRESRFCLHRAWLRKSSCWTLSLWTKPRKFWRTTRFVALGHACNDPVKHQHQTHHVIFHSWSSILAWTTSFASGAKPRTDVPTCSFLFRAAKMGQSQRFSFISFSFPFVSNTTR